MLSNMFLASVRCIYRVSVNYGDNNLINGNFIIYRQCINFLWYLFSWSAEPKPIRGYTNSLQALDATYMLYDYSIAICT